MYVALSSGSAFSAASLWHGNFAAGAEVPVVGDFNGDGMDDIATFTRGAVADVYVALSTGSRFTSVGGPWHANFAVGAETPGTGDFNGDGRDDIVTFTGAAAADVYVALSDGIRFSPTAGLWHTAFAGGVEAPGVGDFDGNESSDVVTYLRGADGRVFVARSDGARFGDGQLWHNRFGLGTEWPRPSLLTPASS